MTQTFFILFKQFSFPKNKSFNSLFRLTVKYFKMDIYIHTFEININQVYLFKNLYDLKTDN